MRNTHESLRLGAALRALAGAGSIVDSSVARTPEENSEVEIRLVGGVHESMVFELPDGRAGYILDSEITNQTSKTIYFVPEPELRMQWEDALFRWLPDPKEAGRTFSYTRRKRDGSHERVEATYESYCFPGGLEYTHDLVLNHVLLKGCSLQPGCPLTGLLLATGGPLPHNLRHGQWLKPTLALTASDHREYTAQIWLWTDRLDGDERRATRKPSLYRDTRGFEVGSPVVVGNQHGEAHSEKPRSLDTDGPVGRLSL
jgi:hypothetical protein